MKCSKIKDKEELDTSSLHSGMVVKNYEEMCRLLNQDIMAGNSKKAQLEQWRRYFDWESDGHKFIILTVYEEPISGMLPDNAIYAKFMQLALMEALFLWMILSRNTVANFHRQEPETAVLQSF